MSNYSNANVEQWQVRKSAVSSPNGVVAAQHHLAARAGAEVLADGGNAVDAAVACALALAALEPWMCGLGGSGYMVIWSATEQRAQVLDFQGMLPAAIDAADYPLDPAGEDSIMGFPAVKDQRNVIGYGAVTVPGAVAGFDQALKHFGTYRLADTLQPAIALAERGLPLGWFGTLNIALAMPELRRDPVASSVYLPDGVPAAPEQYLSLGALAETLRALAASDGAESFYRGELAASMAADLQAGGSRISADDFAAYQVLQHDSLSCEHRGVTLHTAGSTSGGPRLIDTLNYSAEHLKPEQGLNGAAWKIYIDALNIAWRNHKARLAPVQTGGCTSHLSAVDKDGNMVALTYTLLNRFGAAVVLPETGILMNNSVSYFDPRPGFPTSLAGHKRINSSNMCPTIACRDGEALFALGASGANFIQPCTTLLAALMLDFGMSLEQAFNHPRVDASDRGSVRVDPRLGDDLLNELSEHFELEIAQRLTFPKLYSCPAGVSRDPGSGVCYGINDPSQPIGGAVGG